MQVLKNLSGQKRCPAKIDPSKMRGAFQNRNLSSQRSGRNLSVVRSPSNSGQDAIDIQTDILKALKVLQGQSPDKLLAKKSVTQNRRLVRTAIEDCPDANQLCGFPPDQPDCPLLYTGSDPVCPIGNLSKRITVVDSNSQNVFLLDWLAAAFLFSPNLKDAGWLFSRPGITSITVVGQGGVNEPMRQYTYNYTDANSYGIVSSTTWGTWSGLHAPYKNSSPCEYPVIKYLDVCYNPDRLILGSVLQTTPAILVTKTAQAKFKRVHSWEVSKSANTSDLVLSPGQTALVNYTVTGSNTYADADWAVFGTITIKNRNPIYTGDDVSIVIESVDDLVSPTALISFPVTFPYVLQGQETIVGTYTALVGAPGAGSGVTTVTASRGNETEVFSATASWDFSNPSTEIDVIDECVVVTDSLTGELGNFCVGSTTGYLIEYQAEIGPFEACGNFEVENLVTAVANDTGSTSSDAWIVSVTVPCVGGCTLSQGYWKTHSEHGPAPYDDTWSRLSYGANTVFFNSGKTYYNVLKTAPAGNVYYILAPQFIAAELNQLNGAAMPPDVLSAYNAAANLFGNASYTPSYINGLKGSSSLRKQFISLAATLEEYNTGITGPGHCSE